MDTGLGIGTSPTSSPAEPRAPEALTPPHRQHQVATQPHARTRKKKKFIQREPGSRFQRDIIYSRRVVANQKLPCNFFFYLYQCCHVAHSSRVGNNFKRLFSDTPTISIPQSKKRPHPQTPAPGPLRLPFPYPDAPCRKNSPTHLINTAKIPIKYTYYHTTNLGSLESPALAPYYWVFPWTSYFFTFFQRKSILFTKSM